MFGRIVGYSVEGLYSREVLDQVRDFLSKHSDDLVEIQKTLDQSFEKAEDGLKWKIRDGNVIDTLTTPIAV